MGSQLNAIDLGAFFPQTISETKRRSETGEAIFKNFYRDAPNPCLTFEDQGHVTGKCEVKGKNAVFTVCAIGSVRLVTKISNLLKLLLLVKERYCISTKVKKVNSKIRSQKVTENTSHKNTLRRMFLGLLQVDIDGYYHMIL